MQTMHDLNMRENKRGREGRRLDRSGFLRTQRTTTMDDEDAMKTTRTTKTRRWMKMMGHPSWFAARIRSGRRYLGPIISWAFRASEREEERGAGCWALK